MRRYAFVLALVMLPTAFASASPSAPAPPRLEACRVAGVDETVRCADLLLRENPADPESRKIKLHVVVLPALHAQRPPAAPLFDLAGGPGIAGSSAATFYATDGSVHRLHRDIVLIDQRGTGESNPLRCPELELNAQLPTMYPADIVRRCRATLAKSADLSQYTTANAAADVEAVRAALGYARIDISALSYGTRVALTYMRRYPQRVRAAVLMGTVADTAKVPLWHARNAETTLHDLFADCANDVTCRDNYPDIEQKWHALLAAVAAQPKADAGESHIKFGPGPFAEKVRTLLYTTDGQRRLPALIAQMSGGDFTPLFGSEPEGFFAEGLLLSVTCAEDVAFISDIEREEATAATFLGAYRIDEQRTACKEWNVPPVAEVQPPAARSDIPVLLLAGERDAVTPPAWAHAIGGQFARSRVISIPFLGHFPAGLVHMECFDAMIAAFFAGADPGKVDAGCVAAMKPPPFALPGSTATRH